MKLTKKLIPVLLTLCFLLNLVFVLPVAATEAVTPTKDWYVEGQALTIANASDLMAFSEALQAGKTFTTVTLTADIDLNPGFDGTAATLEKAVNVWAYNGNQTHFYGTFDGKGHTISGIYQNAPNGYAGIFGGQFATGTVTIKDLTIKNSYIVSGAQYTGALMGLMNKSGFTVADFDNLNIDVNIHVTYANNNTETQMFAGGLIGHVNINDTVTIDNCAYTGKMSFSDTTGVSRVGGFIGQVTLKDNSTLTDTSVNIQNSGFYGTIEAVDEAYGYLGAFIGRVNDSYNLGAVTLNKCVAAGTISAVSFGGGVKGQFLAAKADAPLTLTNCYAINQFVKNGTALTGVELYTNANASSVTTGSKIISELPDACYWQCKAAANNKADLRFVATINALDHEGVGLEVVCSNGKTYFAGENAVIKTAYTKITGDNETYTAGEDKLAGGKYIIMVIITGVDATDASDALTFTVKPYTVVDGVRVYGESETMTWDGIPAVD